MLCDKKDVLCVVSDFNFYQIIVLPEVYRLKSWFSNIDIFHYGCFLYNTFLCCHKEIFIFVIITERYNRCYLLLRHKLNKIDYCCSSRCTATFRYLIHLKPIHSSFVCKEHYIVVCRCHKHIFDIIIIYRLHSLYALTATVLALKVVYWHTLDISEFCHCDDRIFVWYKVLHWYVKFIISDRCSSVITVFVTDFNNLFFDNTK